MDDLHTYQYFTLHDLWHSKQVKHEREKEHALM